MINTVTGNYGNLLMSNEFYPTHRTTAFQPQQQQNLIDLELAKYNELFSYWKDFRLNHLKNDLEIFQKQIEAHKIQQFEISSKFKSVQGALFSSINDKTGTCQKILLDFQNNLNTLVSRIGITENLVTNLVTFFSNMEKTIPGNSNVFQLNNTLATTIHHPTQMKKDDYLTTNLNTSNFAYLKPNNVVLPSTMTNETIETTKSSVNNASSDRREKNRCQSCTAYDLATVDVPEESTELIAKKVREYLQISKISQRKFAETLLHMKQANFSALLSQPLAWPQLSKTYRDRFLTMYLWLNDPYRMDKLNKTFYKNQNKYSVMSAENFEYDESENGDSKRRRNFLSNDQTDKLKTSFIKNPYPAPFEIDIIAIEAGLNSKKVATWFAHQRQLYKIQNKRIKT